MRLLWMFFCLTNIILPIQCNKPVFSEDAWIQILFLPYDTPTGSAIYRVQANDNEAVPNYPLTFSVIGRGSEVVDVVSVSPTEADLVLKRSLTRGKIYPIALQVADTANERNVIEIRLNATDVSAMVNNALLSYPEKPISVPEDTRPGSVIGTIIAKKRQDSDRYPDLILSKSSKFRLDISLTSSEAQGRIILTEALDYEVRNYYTLNVTVYRGPYNKLLDNRNILVIPIIIVVEDVQDTNPIFTQLPLLTRMRSDMPAGTSILQVRAIDGDRSAARSIIYSIQGENSQHFHMNSRTGEVTTSNPGHQISKGCQDSAFIINVKAEEENDRRAQTTQEIVVFIQAAIKPQPKFIPDNLKTNIDENLPILTTLTFQQPLHLVDEGNCATLLLSIQDDGNVRASEIFGLSPTLVVRSSDIEIFVKNPKQLDYEQIKEITFRIIARPENPSTDSDTSTAVITISINDLNDNGPKFLQDRYITQISESAPGGKSIIQVTATDADSGNNKNIRYTKILSEHQVSDVFNLDSETGTITLARSGALDREKIDQYQLEVEACDQQGRGRCNKTIVIVQVTDYNDKKPTFDSNHYFTCLTNGMTQGKTFFSLRAIDKDEPGSPNSEIRYEITGGNLNSYFHINQQGNLSTTTDARNIPKNQEIQLLIRAVDSGSPPQSSETTVHISTDPAKCSQQVVEFVVTEGENDIKRKKAEYERILTELNSGSITRIEQVKATDDESKTRIIASVVQPANKSVIDLTVWERQFKNSNGDFGSPSTEPEYGTTKVAVAESEAWKWILIALLILLAIVFIVLLCCCLCRPNSKLKTTSQVYNKHKNQSSRDDQHHPPRPRHHHRHRQQHATDRITSAPMANGKTNIPYSRHIPEEVIVDSLSIKRQQTATAIRNTETTVSQKSANPPRIVQEMQTNESSGQSEVVAVVSEDTTADVDDNGPHAQLKNQFLEKKSLFTIAYDGMHSKHDLLKDRDYPPTSNTPIS